MYAFLFCYRIMGKLVRKDRPRVTQTTPAVDRSSSAKSSVVKTATFKAKTTINAKTAKAHPKVSTTKVAALKLTKPSNLNEAAAPDAVPLVPVALPTVPAVIKRQITKKEKIQNRHDNLMRKVNTALLAKRSVKLKAKVTKNQKKQKLAQVSKTTAHAVRTAMADMSLMKEALPSLDDQLPSLSSLFQLKSKDLKTGVPKLDAKATKAAAADGGARRKVSKTTNTLNKKNEFMQRYNLLQKLSNDKTFRKNPREVIAAHVRNRQAQQV